MPTNPIQFTPTHSLGFGTRFMQLEGGTELALILGRLPRTIQNRLLRVELRKGTKVFADEAKARAPVDTGLLKGALGVRSLKRKVGRIGFRVFINTKGKGGRTKAAKAKREGGGFFTKTKAGETHFYPAVLEYGSEKHPAQPFLRPAFDAKRKEVEAMVIAGILAGIREATTGVGVASKPAGGAIPPGAKPDKGGRLRDERGRFI